MQAACAPHTRHVHHIQHCTPAALEGRARGQLATALVRFHVVYRRRLLRGVLLGLARLLALLLAVA
eukprot:2249581-Pleurochrysis_carterae.AAC.1